jgi:hypothetical protein
MTLDGNVVQVWDSITLVSNTLNIVKSNIFQCCCGKLNTAGGWHWIYYEDYIEHDPNEELREIHENSEFYS